jgi:flagellar hook-length control protein FliK
MASNNRQVAELRVDPPQLGPVEVRLSINGEQASLSLVSANAGVREALQASIPRLQDMIQSIGLELGSVTVGSESFSRQQEQAEHQPGPYRQEHAADSPAVLEAVAWPSRPVMGRGLVDIFA